VCDCTCTSMCTIAVSNCSQNCFDVKYSHRYFLVDPEVYRQCFYTDSLHLLNIS
jgi:hypothetical protein